MCCHACPGYDVCKSRNALKDDCCVQCRYFTSCMEESLDDEEKPARGQPVRRA